MAAFAGLAILVGVLATVFSGASQGSAAIGGPIAAAQFGLRATDPSTSDKPVLAGVPLTFGVGARLLTGSSVPAVRSTAARQVQVAPLRRTVPADLLIVAPSALPAALLAEVSKLPGMVADERIEAVRLRINGTDTAVVGADPSTFRSFAAGPTGAANALWQGVADGGCVEAGSELDSPDAHGAPHGDDVLAVHVPVQQEDLDQRPGAGGVAVRLAGGGPPGVMHGGELPGGAGLLQRGRPGQRAGLAAGAGSAVQMCCAALDTCRRTAMPITAPPQLVHRYWRNPSTWPVMRVPEQPGHLTWSVPTPLVSARVTRYITARSGAASIFCNCQPPEWQVQAQRVR